MKTAIIYSTTHGTTEKIAVAIKDALGVNAYTFNLKSVKKVDLGQFDQIVIGGSIHAGKIQKNIMNFCKTNLLELLNKKLALFICGMNEPEIADELKNAYPDLLLKHSTVSVAVGGEFLFEKMNFFERLIVRKITGINKTVSVINWNQVDVLINKLN